MIYTLAPELTTSFIISEFGGIVQLRSYAFATPVNTGGCNGWEQDACVKQAGSQGMKPSFASEAASVESLVLFVMFRLQL